MINTHKFMKFLFSFVRSNMMYLLPKPILNLHKESQAKIKNNEKLWEEMTALNVTEAKAQCLGNNFISFKYNMR